MSTRILLADDHELMRNGLRTLLEREPDFEVVAEAETGRQAIDMVQKHQPDIVVMDITMPDMSGIAATIRITELFKGTRVLALSMHPAGNMVEEMFNAGAMGYLTKNCAAGELVEAIRRVSLGEIYLSPEIIPESAKGYPFTSKEGQKDTRRISLLTARESEVLQLVAEGKPTKMIASDLCISEKTVGAHRQNIMGKLGIRSIAELTKFAIREGLTPLD
jgi:DNA-binding NarL/FixJ family response regulator